MAFSVDEAIVRAKSLAMLGDIDQAKQLYRTVLETFPNNKQAHDGLAELDIFLKQINALVVLYRQGRLEAVLEQGEALSKQYPQSFVLCDVMSTINARLRRWDAAKIFVTKMLQIKPDHAVTHYNLGIILKELGRHGEAIDCFTRRYRSILATPMRITIWATAFENSGVTTRRTGTIARRSN